MASYRDWITALRDLGLGQHSRVLVHASLDSLAPVAGGADTVVGALAATCEMVVTQAFTERTLITPPVGPPDNGLIYGEVVSTEAEIFRPDLPVDPALGSVAEAFRRHPKAGRSGHPALSFSGIQADEALQAQTLEEPLGPVRWLADFDADIVLIGVDHRRNVGLHWAEALAGRKQFVRWALTPEGVVECPAYPGCPDGFQAIAPRLGGITREAAIGDDPLQAIPLRDLIHVVVAWIREDPRALLCSRTGCQRCAAVRAAVRIASP